MKILITGATGLIGRRLTERLVEHLIRLPPSPVLRTRRKNTGCTGSAWETLDGKTSLDGFDAVINLAGEPIADKRCTKEYKPNLRKPLAVNRKTGPALNASNATFSLISVGSGFITAIRGGVSPRMNRLISSLLATLRPLGSAGADGRKPAHRVCLLRTGIGLAAKGVRCESRSAFPRRSRRPDRRWSAIHAVDPHRRHGQRHHFPADA